MYPILFKFKGVEITSFGLMLGLAFLAAGLVASVEFKRKGYDKDVAWTLLMGALIGGIVGAKLYYAFLNWPFLVRDPFGTVFSRAGLVWYGGLIGGSLGVIYLLHREKLPLAEVADVGALSIPAAYAIGRVGCFLVGDDYGRPTDSWLGIAFPNGSPPSTAGNLRDAFGVALPESISDWEVLSVHPTQLYEVALTTVILLVLWRLRRHPHRAGWLFMAWVALAGLERFAVEFLRAKDDRFFGVLTLAQMISLAMIAGGLYGAWTLSRPRLAAEGKA
jgi:phosphatidylglycerol:prolipoprotein diacylglycerol transferase